MQLEIAGPVIDASGGEVRFPFWRVPADGVPDSGGRQAQGWSMIGREDLAAGGSEEYRVNDCAMVPGSPLGWEAVVDEIAERAADYRVVIINESHVLSRHRQTTRMLLEKLRPLGFTVLAAETFSHRPSGPSPVEEEPVRAYPLRFDGFYLAEPAFGRLFRTAHELGYRLAPYEEVFDPSNSSDDPLQSVIGRETAQARHLAEILAGMDEDERLVVHAGYSHGSEVPLNFNGSEVDWMGARFKALTGIDPLTVSQTSCRHAEGPAFLAEPPESLREGQFDIVVSHPVEQFTDQRLNWRREAGDIAVAIPEALRPIEEPLIIEAHAAGEPDDAVPMDRVYVEPGEEVPLLLPPGNYRVSAVRPWREASRAD